MLEILVRGFDGDIKSGNKGLRSVKLSARL